MSNENEEECISLKMSEFQGFQSELHKLRNEKYTLEQNLKKQDLGEKNLKKVKKKIPNIFLICKIKEWKNKYQNVSQQFEQAKSKKY